MKKRVRSQRPVRGGRRPAYTGMTQQIEKAVRDEMRMYKVSRSFVIANALAFTFKIEGQEDYHEEPEPKNGRPR
jgi:hypothetical protein